MSFPRGTMCCLWPVLVAKPGHAHLLFWKCHIHSVTSIVFLVVFCVSFSGAVGLSVDYECGISWSYSLAIY